MTDKKHYEARRNKIEKRKHNQSQQTKQSVKQESGDKLVKDLSCASKSDKVKTADILSRNHKPQMNKKDRLSVGIPLTKSVQTDTIIEKIKQKVLTDWKGQNEFVDWLDNALKSEGIANPRTEGEGHIVPSSSDTNSQDTVRITKEEIPKEQRHETNPDTTLDEIEKELNYQIFGQIFNRIRIDDFGTILESRTEIADKIRAEITRIIARHKTMERKE